MRCLPPDPLAAAQAAFLDDLGGRVPRTAAERAVAFAAPATGSLEDRWHVYAHGYRARIEEALALDYRALRRIAGPGPFEQLVARYLLACPPRAFDLARAGDRLPEFLAGDPLALTLPFLPDLARLERAVGASFVAADSLPLTWDTVVRFAPEDLAAARFRLRPGVALVESSWPLLELWAARDVADEEVSIELEGGSRSVLVHRPVFAVDCVPAGDDAAAIVAAAIEKGTVNLPELGATERFSDGEPGVRRLLDGFRQLVGLGIFLDHIDSGEPRRGPTPNGGHHER